MLIGTCAACTEQKPRIERLERSLLAFASLITGEAAKVMNEQELAVVQYQLAVDLEGMRDDQ